MISTVASALYECTCNVYISVYSQVSSKLHIRFTQYSFSNERKPFRSLTWYPMGKYGGVYARLPGRVCFQQNFILGHHTLLPCLHYSHSPHVMIAWLKRSLPKSIQQWAVIKNFFPFVQIKLPFSSWHRNRISHTLASNAIAQGENNFFH